MTPADFPAADYTTAIVVGLIFLATIVVAVIGFTLTMENAVRRISYFLGVTGVLVVVSAMGIWSYFLIGGAEDRRNELIGSAVEEWLQEDYGISASIDANAGLLDDPKIEGMRVSDGERMLTIVLEGGSSYALVDDDSKVIEPHQ